MINYFFFIIALASLVSGFKTSRVHYPVQKPNVLDTPEAEDDRVYSIPSQGPLLSANYAGYISIPNSDGIKMFYFLIESEGNPETDPVMLWLNGGPGCSSLIGLYTENGPYIFRLNGTLALNEYRWTTNTTMLYLDSPPGVGFSVDPKSRTWNDNNTAVNSYQFLKLFFQRYPRLRKNKFYLSGESYAGFYVPELAYEIFKGDDADLKASMNGWMVGNPCTGKIGCMNDDPTLIPFSIYHGFDSLNKKLSHDTSAHYDPYDLLVPVCTKKIELMMTKRFQLPHMEALRNKLIKTPSVGLPPYGPCVDDFFVSFLNKAEVKAAIHADHDITYSECANIVYHPNLIGVTDIYMKLADKTNWSIMVFSGTADSVVNFVQTETTLIGLNRTLVSTTFDHWSYPDVYNPSATQLGGFFMEWDRLTWATVRNAGHMVPMYNPPAAKELHTSFMAIGKPGRLR